MADAKPSLKIARERAKQYMLHDPQTRAPYRHWGLFAPLTAFERLSGDLGAYMRMVQEGLLLCVLATLASIPSFILNFDGAGGPIGTYNRWMSIGVAAELSWGHVLSQAVVSCMCLYYIRRQRSYLIDTQMQKNKVARRFVDAARKQRKLRDRMRAVLKRGGRAGHHTERARERRKGTCKPTSPTKGGRRLTHLARGASAKLASKIAGRRGGNANRVLPESSVPEDSEVVTASPSAERRMGPSEASANGVPGLSRSGGSPPPMGPLGSPRSKSDDNMDAMGNMLSDVCEACSVVLYGWPKGRDLPDGTVDLLEVAAGAKIISLVRPEPCRMIVRQQRVQQRLTTRHEWVTVTLGALEASDAAKEGRVSKAQQQAAKALSQIDKQLEIVNSKLANLYGAVEPNPPIAFAVFPSSSRARAVLDAYRERRLFPAGTAAAEGGVKVAPAPNPSDVVWEHLEIPRGKRQRAYVRNALILAPLMLLSSIGISFSTYAQVSLNAVPFFSLGAVEFSESIVLLLHWLWTTGILLLSFQLIIQPAKAFAIAAAIEDFIEIRLARNGFDAQIIGHARQYTLSLHPDLIALA